MGEIRLGSLEDVQAIESVPIEERAPATNTYDLIRLGAAANPAHTALYFLLSGAAWENPVEVSYADLVARVTQAANFFSDLGVGKTDVVSFLLPNLPQTHYVLWGAEAAGVAGPINPLLEPAQICGIMQAAKTKVLVALGEMPGTDIWAKVEAVRASVPSLEAVVRVLGPSDERNGIFGFEESIERYDAERLCSGRRFDPGETCSLYHTGGTTGTPKLARRSHFNEVFSAVVLSLCLDLGAEDTMLCGLPLFHANAPLLTGLTPFARGSSVVLLGPTGFRDREVIRNFYRIVERYRASCFMAVPTVLSMLLDVPVGDADTSSLRYAMCGAAPLSVEVFRAFERHTGLKLLEGYGLTEATVASSCNPRDGIRKIGSVGLRLPYQQIRTVIVDAEGRFVRECAPNEIGLVVMRGPNVFQGYVQEEHNRAVWVDGDWLNTGDMGRIDEDGYLWLTGRKKELIIRGGHNIDPATIEEPLYGIEGVELAAAVGQPDAHAGEVPVAYVQLKAGSRLTAEEIQSRLRHTISERAAIPKEVRIVDKMPLTAVGKIFKPALRYHATQEIFTRELSALGDEAQAVAVTVGEDKRFGTLARVRIKVGGGADPAAVLRRARDLLSRYPVHSEIELE